MPIRSPRGRAAAYRGIWQWPLRSPARLAVTAVAVVVVAVGVSLGITAAGGGPDRGVLGGPTQAASSPRSVPRTTGQAPPPGTAGPVPSVLAPVPELAPSTLPLSQAPAEALAVAARWSAAWIRPAAGTTTQQWIEGLRASTTEEYLGVLGATDPSNVPATRVTGEPRPVRVAAGSVQVEVPTDALTLLLLVVDTETGWRVASHDRA